MTHSMDTRHHHQYDAMLQSDQQANKQFHPGAIEGPYSQEQLRVMPIVAQSQQRIASQPRDGDPDFHPVPQPWTQSDALLSEVLRVLHGLRADIEAMNETLRKMREERHGVRVVAFPATALRNGTPR
jgi:hypothetical protein